MKINFLFNVNHLNFFQLGDVVGHVPEVEAERGGRARTDLRRAEGRPWNVGHSARKLYEAALQRCRTVASQLQVHNRGGQGMMGFGG